MAGPTTSKNIVPLAHVQTPNGQLVSMGSMTSLEIPTNELVGYAPFCIVFVPLNHAHPYNPMTNATAIYQNVGTAASSKWAKLGSLAA